MLDGVEEAVLDEGFQRFATNHPLVVRPVGMVIRTVQLGALDQRLQPPKQLLVTLVHAHRDLRLLTVSAKAAFSH